LNGTCDGTLTGGHGHTAVVSGVGLSWPDGSEDDGCGNRGQGESTKHVSNAWAFDIHLSHLPDCCRANPCSFIDM
jgi:hypothetical protein